MGTYTDYKSTYNLLKGLKGLISAVLIGVISTLNLPVLGTRMFSHSFRCLKIVRVDMSSPKPYKP